MSSIPYSITKQLSAQLKWPNKLYWSVFQVLIESNGLQLVLNSNQLNPLFKSETAYYVLKHIIYRTLQFEKAFEFVRWKDIINGIPTNAIAGCSLSEATIKRVLTQLSPPNSDWLIKLRFVRNGSRVITPLYGLNLPGFLQLNNIWWRNIINDEELSKDSYEIRVNRKPSNLMLRGRCKLTACVDFLAEWMDAFNFLAKYSKQISDMERFIKQWATHFPKSKDRADLICKLESDLDDCKGIKKLRKQYLAELEE